MSHLYRRGEIYWYSDWVAGRKIRRSLKTRNRRVAFAKKAQLDVAASHTHHTSRDADLTFMQAASLYLTASRPRKTPATHRNDELRLQQLTASLGPLQLMHLTPGRLESCLTELAHVRGLSASTRNHYLTLLRKMLNWCASRGFLIDNPSRGIERLKPIVRPRAWLTTAQRDQLLTLAKGSFYFPMVATAIYAGLRWRELATLEWKDVDFERNLVHIRPKEDWAPKSRKPRLIPLHPRLKAILRPRRQPEGVCFPTPAEGRGMGRPYKTDANTRLLKRWLKAVGIEQRGASWHTLRHSFATGLVQAGVSVWKVKEWLGHQDVRTTELYAHASQGYDADISRIG